ncbi:ArnT family glycosyltransferase [Patescibacteria group bacterium]
MNLKKPYYILFIILLLGVVLRFWQLGNVPVGVHRDEAFMGYEAYSMLKTGKFMSGDFLPSHSKAFLYSPAGYIYASIIPVALFGLNAFSIRFASAASGVLSILATYYLVLMLFGKYKLKIPLALASALFLTISPWHINLSRTASENSLVVFLNILGIYFFLKWVKTSKLAHLLIYSLSFLASLFTYQASRSFLPLLFPYLLYLTGNKFKASKKLISIFIYISVILLPIFAILLNPNLNTRIRTLGLNADSGTQLKINESLTEDSISGTNIYFSRFFHNKFSGYISKFIENYFSHFSYPFLFTDAGFPERYKVPSSGILLFSDLILIPLGLYLLIRKRKRSGKILLFWLIVAPIGSSMAFDDIPNMQRTLLVFPSLSIISAYAFIQLTIKFRNNILSPRRLVTVLMLVSLTYYLHQYYIHQIKHQPWHRQEGYQQLVNQINKKIPEFNKAIITNRESAPAIFFLFYGKYNPLKYLQLTANLNIKDYDRANFDKYQFSQEECPLRLITDENGKVVPSGKSGILYVNYFTCENFEGVETLSIIKRSDNSDIFKIVVLTNY